MKIEENNKNKNILNKSSNKFNLSNIIDSVKNKNKNKNKNLKNIINDIKNNNILPILKGGRNNGATSAMEAFGREPQESSKSSSPLDSAMSVMGDSQGKDSSGFLGSVMGAAQGKDPSGKKDEKSKYKNDKNFIAKMTISEIQKQKMIKVVEDILMGKKKTDNSEVGKKDGSVEASSMIKRNIKSVLKQAEKEGLSKKDIIKLLGSE